jgi:hypothetical protein
MRSAAVAIPLARARTRRTAALAGAALAVFAGIGWSVYAAATEPGAADVAASIGRVLLVVLGLLALRILLTRPQMVVGNHALAIVAPLRFARPVAIARDAIEAVGFDAPRSLTISLAAPLPRGGEPDRVLVPIADVDLARSVLADWGTGPEAQPPRPFALRLPPITSMVAVLAIVACCVLLELTLRLGAGELAPVLVLALALTFAADGQRYRQSLAAAVAAYRPRHC